MMPLAIPIQPHDCDYEANTNCNRIDTQYLMVKMQLMLEVSRTERERDFVLDYFSYGFKSDDGLVELGGTALLHNTYTMIFEMDSKYTILRHCEHPEYKDMDSDDYADTLLIDSDQSLDEIFLNRASQSHGTYFRFSFGDTVHDFIGLATHARSIIEGSTSMHVEKGYVLVVAYPNIDKPLNPFCGSTSNLLCVLKNAEYVLGALQSAILPEFDESEDNFRIACLNAAYDRTNSLGRQYGMEVELLNDEGDMLVPFTMTTSSGESTIGKSYYDVYSDNMDDANTLAVDEILETIFEASMDGDTVTNFLWGDSHQPYISYVGYQIYNKRDNLMLANFISYFDNAAPLTPVHDLEVETEFVSIHSIHNIQSYMGEAVHYLLQQRSMQQIGTLLAASRKIGLKPFLIMWELTDNVEVPSIILIQRTYPFPTAAFEIPDTNLLKIPVAFLMKIGILNAERWNRVSLTTDGHQWAELSWFGGTLFGNFFRAYDPDTGTRMTFGFSSVNTLAPYDETCPLRESMPCSEGTMDAMLSIVARDASLYDERARYTIGSSEELRMSGDMGVVVFETDGVIIYNSRSTDVSGWSLAEWAQEWDMTSSLLELNTESQIMANLPGLLKRLPFHFKARIDTGADFDVVSGIVDTVMLSSTQFSVLVFHVLKPVEAYPNLNGTSTYESGNRGSDGQLASPYVDPCASFFAHDCSYRYAELLVSKVQEGLIHLYMNGDFTSMDEFDNYVMDLHAKEELRDAVLAEMFITKDYWISLIRGSSSNIIAGIYDMDEKINVGAAYNVPVYPAYAFNVTVHDVYDGWGKVTQLGELYEPYNGIPVDHVVEVFRDRGCLPNAEDRWLDFTLESPSATFISKQYMKTFVIGGEFYYLMVDASGTKPNTKCSNGCPTHSHCAADDMFCICDDDAFLVDDNDDEFICEPILVSIIV
eukprot:TRINITY_DN4003_c1_g1_i5.p1 TRINITY_DN4003_c1_g1~~TRINITY_DN4003_c1_g1_i5.p1  ORF type:complete len:1060 (+),score=302.25 TRINITY_DN4003_c1_g1_i5:390-3182(+)